MNSINCRTNSLLKDCNKKTDISNYTGNIIIESLKHFCSYFCHVLTFLLILFYLNVLFYLVRYPCYSQVSLTSMRWSVKESYLPSVDHIIERGLRSLTAGLWGIDSGNQHTVYPLQPAGRRYDGALLCAAVHYILTLSAHQHVLLTSSVIAMTTASTRGEATLWKVLLCRLWRQRGTKRHYV